MTQLRRPFNDRADLAPYRGDNDKTYLFTGQWFVRYSTIGGGIDDGYPVAIAAHGNGLPSAFEQGFDAALWRQSNGKITLVTEPRPSLTSAAPMPWSAYAPGNPGGTPTERM
jgi:hypothetical protein